ncbi:MAG: SAM-dependent methyltransferase [Streptosporangiaceae bacterium]|nr:SAM-dependent methyltransferase [Streptosporangiaceae bacterium]
MTPEQSVPAGIDVSKPNVARVYDALLGGKDNFAADREFIAMAMAQTTPDAPLAVRANRAFLRRVVRFLVGQAGIDQLLDIGSGLPTQGNVSEVAQEVNPRAKVVYVDNDPVVCLHSKALLVDSTTTDIITGDIRRPEEILRDPTVRGLIDFGRPVGLLLLAILHHIADSEDPAGIAAVLRDAMPSGSYLAISSFRMPGPELPEIRERTIRVEKVLAENLGTGRWREDEEILRWFGDWELLDPGLVPLAEWRPFVQGPARKNDTYYTLSGGVARKP